MLLDASSSGLDFIHIPPGWSFELGNPRKSLPARDKGIVTESRQYILFFVVVAGNNDITVNDMVLASLKACEGYLFKVLVFV